VTKKELLAALEIFKVDIMQLAEDLRERIESLERERARLLGELEGIREKLDTRTTSLESEVDRLRKEKEMLQKLLGSPSEEEN
jgi:predicted  nucleic acid-binding Zn-ribbon protein